MSKLIKNELTKIFKKKSIYITLLVILAFVILTNCIYKFFYNSSTFYGDTYIEYAKEELAKLDPNKVSDIKMYIDLKTTVEIYEMQEKYEKDDWRRDILSVQVGTYINEKNNYLYGEDKDLEKVAQVQEKINKIMEKLEKDDWKYFANEELENAKLALSDLEEQKKNMEDKQEIKNLESSIENAKIDEEVARYRVDKDIKYGNDYRNRALNEYQSCAKNVKNYENSDQKLEYSDQKRYNTDLEEREINRYIIENNVDINKGNDIRGILRNFFSEYGLFIIVMVIMIAGTIVSEEFSKGTIKLLLVKPYPRYKILMSKWITVMIMILFSIVALIVMELIVGGIIFGYDSLSVPVLHYNFDTQSLEAINVFADLGLQTITQLPKVILLAMLAFSFSTLFTNSAVAIAIPLLGYMSADVINSLVVNFKVDFMRFFVSLNWDFGQYLYGNLPKLEGLTLWFSAIICILYFVAMIIPTFITFKKRNIKNV
ncbi:MAG: ABC transporter permease subunit [Clostridia bacterium]|nr:ABC transporter permease subunit [Clostridia bacterium]